VPNDWSAERLVGDGAERDDDNLGREHEVGTDGPLDLVSFESRQVNIIFGQQRQLPSVLGVVIVTAMQPAVSQFLGSFEAQINAAEHQ